MEPYRFDPYTGRPLSSSSAGGRGWSDNPYNPRSFSQPSAAGQAEQPNVIVTRVASFDEAKAVPTDFSGALRLMLDWDHGYIYAKAVGNNGAPVFKAYRYDPRASSAIPVPPVPEVRYAPLEEVERLREEVAAIRGELAQTPVKEPSEKNNGKGSKA